MHKNVKLHIKCFSWDFEIIGNIAEPYGEMEKSVGKGKQLMARHSKLHSSHSTGWGMNGKTEWWLFGNDLTSLWLHVNLKWLSTHSVLVSQQLSPSYLLASRLKSTDLVLCFSLIKQSITQIVIHLKVRPIQVSQARSGPVSCTSVSKMSQEKIFILTEGEKWIMVSTVWAQRVRWVYSTVNRIRMEVPVNQSILHVSKCRLLHTELNINTLS